MLKIHNFVTAPLTDFFLHPKTCPPSVIFGNNFIDYFYIWFTVLLVCWSCVYYVFKKIVEVNIYIFKSTLNSHWLKMLVLRPYSMPKLATLTTCVLTEVATTYWSDYISSQTHDCCSVVCGGCVGGGAAERFPAGGQ